jgi:imidazolonepropionase-like amidohydrolase/ABC-type multidrug transport system permease subunit
MVRTYAALIRIQLKLAFREKNVLFFNYVFPLIFFFGFGQLMGGGGMTPRVLSMVLVIGILGSGLFGAGLRSVLERETNILRRYKVTPITPMPLLVASMVTGWLLYLPSAALLIALGHFIYKMPWPNRMFSLFALVTLGCFAFRAIGLIIAAIANSMAEANVMVQLLYMPMLFLSGATIPVSVLPLTAQIIAQFLPASYLHSGMQQVLLRSQGLWSNAEAILSLVASTTIALWVSVKLFRWEKEEKIPTRSKAWVAAVFFPFLMLGVYQAYSREHINETKLLDREMRRKQARLIRDARIFVGDGRVIERGAVLIHDGRIVRVFEGASPDADSLNADALEAVGKTVLPGLIDVHVHLASPGGALPQDLQFYDPEAAMMRASAAYLYSGVVAVKSAGDFTSAAVKVRQTVNPGVRLGAEIFLCGPVFTAPEGHGTEYFKHAPAFLKNRTELEFTRIPKTPEEARAQVRELKKEGVDGIKAVLEAGIAGQLFQRMDVAILRAIGEEARAQGLPMVVHTGDSNDIADAIQAGAIGIEHGSMRDRIPDETFALMKQRGIHYDPTLSVGEAVLDMRAGRVSLLERTLVEQVAPERVVAASKQAFARSGPESSGKESSGAGKPARDAAFEAVKMDVAMDNLLRAWKAGVPVVTGTDSGAPLLIHGPAIHRELQLWVKAGIPASAALQAATQTAARLLRAEKRLGTIEAGREASLVIVDGNPVQDIAATERISAIFFKGERVDRQRLFEQK